MSRGLTWPDRSARSGGTGLLLLLLLLPVAITSARALSQGMACLLVLTCLTCC